MWKPRRSIENKRFSEAYETVSFFSGLRKIGHLHHAIHCEAILRDGSRPFRSTYPKTCSDLSQNMARPTPARQIFASCSGHRMTLPKAIAILWSEIWRFYPNRGHRMSLRQACVILWPNKIRQEYICRAGWIIESIFCVYL